MSLFSLFTLIQKFNEPKQETTSETDKLKKENKRLKKLLAESLDEIIALKSLSNEIKTENENVQKLLAETLVENEVLKHELNKAKNNKKANKILPKQSLRNDSLLAYFLSGDIFNIFIEYLDFMDLISLYDTNLSINIPFKKMCQLIEKSYSDTHTDEESLNGMFYNWSRTIKLTFNAISMTDFKTHICEHKDFSAPAVDCSKWHQKYSHKTSQKTIHSNIQEERTINVVFEHLDFAQYSEYDFTQYSDIISWIIRVNEAYNVSIDVYMAKSKVEYAINFG
eukprot:274148_1